MSKLEDFLGKKKEILPVLDLSKTIVHTKDEYKRLFEKVPDYKMRPIKVRTEDIKIKIPDTNLFVPNKKDYKYMIRHNGEKARHHTYLDPIPLEMRSIAIMDLCTVPIDWKMLTMMRPKVKIEEQFYSKLIELGKMDLKTNQRDKRDTMAIRKLKNKSGIIEMRAHLCSECGEEYCDGRACMDFNYDLYVRVPPKPVQPFKGKSNAANAPHQKLSTKKKSKSFNENATKGKRNGNALPKRVPSTK